MNSQELRQELGDSELRVTDAQVARWIREAYIELSKKEAEVVDDWLFGFDNRIPTSLW